MTQRGLALYPILFVILIIVAGLFLSKIFKSPDPLPVNNTDISRPTPFPSPWDNLETTGKLIRYTNHKYNFQFEVPASWIKRDSTDEFHPVLFSSSTEPYEGVGMSVYVPTVYEDDKEIYEEIFKNNLNLKIDSFDTAKITISPKPNSEPYHGVRYVIRKEPKLVYEIEFGSGTKEDLNNQNHTIQSIMDSFKFLDKNDKQVTLLQYRNDQLGYSFSYPSNWLVNTFQNNGDYNKGITVINEDDKEMFTLHQQSRYGNCDPIAPDKEIYIGNNLYTIKTDCDHPRVKTSKGYEFKMEVGIYGDEVDAKLTDLLKSIEGLKIID